MYENTNIYTNTSRICNWSRCVIRPGGRARLVKSLQRLQGEGEFDRLFWEMLTDFLQKLCTCISLVVRC